MSDWFFTAGEKNHLKVASVSLQEKKANTCAASIEMSDWFFTAGEKNHLKVSL
jgi:hypothetical protein